MTNYGKRLGVLDQSFNPNFTNGFLKWQLEGGSADPTGDQKRTVELQKNVAPHGGYYRLGVTQTAGKA